MRWAASDPVGSLDGNPVVALPPAGIAGGAPKGSSVRGRRDSNGARYSDVNREMMKVM